MNKVIYDIRKDKSIQKMIDQKAQYSGDSFYIKTHGRLGTSEWWDNLSNKGLLVEANVVVENVTKDGKCTISTLFLRSSDDSFEVITKGEERLYSIGDQLQVALAKRSDVFSENVTGWELLSVVKL